MQIRLYKVGTKKIISTLKGGGAVVGGRDHSLREVKLTHHVTK